MNSLSRGIAVFKSKLTSHSICLKPDQRLRKKNKVHFANSTLDGRVIHSMGLQPSGLQTSYYRSVLFCFLASRIPLKRSAKLYNLCIIEKCTQSSIWSKRCLSIQLNKSFKWQEFWSSCSKILPMPKILVLIKLTMHYEGEWMWYIRTKVTWMQHSDNVPARC